MFPADSKKNMGYRKRMSDVRLTRLPQLPEWANIGDGTAAWMRARSSGQKGRGL